MKANFYEYYDQIFVEKDYKKEIEIACKLYNIYSKNKLSSAIDIGCGTGNHSIEMAKRGIKTLGIDNNVDMLRIAQAKAENLKGLPISFYCGNVATVGKEEEYGLAISLFNVVNYIQSIEELIKFFKGVHFCLKTDGIYIFDCWNGIAAIVDQPKRKVSEMQAKDGGVIKSTIIPSNNRLMQKTTLSYKIEIKTARGNSKIGHKIVHSLWTPRDLKEMLKLCHFKVLRICKWMTVKSNITEKDWKIMFVCRK